MIVILILGLALAMSIPAMGRFSQTTRLVASVEGMAGTLRAARQAAVTKNINTVFQFDTGNGTYSYFEDNDRDGAYDAGEYRSAAMTLQTGVLFDSHTLSTTSVTFGPRGNTLESGSIVVGNLKGINRTVTIFGGTGNVRVD